MIIKSTGGQSLIELAVVLPLILSLFLGTMSLFYYAYASLWIQHSLYEGIICLAARSPTSSCRSQVQKLILRGLPIGQLNRLNFKTSLVGRHRVYQGQVRWGFSKSWIYEKQLQIKHKSIYP